MDAVAEIIAKHRSNGHKLCYAESLAPVLARHQFTNIASAKMLRCTLELGHEGDHKDGNCCWTPHTFRADIAGPPEPERYNWERCVECGREWPCDVALIGEELTSS